jgi:hypothetical protein
VGWSRGKGDGRPKRVTAKLRAFLAAYGGPAKLSLKEAAVLAGYKDPARTGSEIKRAWPELVQKAEDEYRAKLVVSSDEAEQALAEIIRNPDHKDRVRAVETALKLHGRLTDKLDVKLNRGELNKALDEAISALAAARREQLETRIPSSQPTADTTPQRADS